MKICDGVGANSPYPILLRRAQPCARYAGRSPAPVMQGAALQEHKQLKTNTIQHKTTLTCSSEHSELSEKKRTFV